MAIIKPFLAGRRFDATIGDGTGTGATFNILVTACTYDSGASATAFPERTKFALCWRDSRYKVKVSLRDKIKAFKSEKIRNKYLYIFS